MPEAAQYILSLDQGTTSSRAIVFGRDGRPVSSGQQEFPQIYPTPGHVEHDPEAIWSSQLATARRALENGKLSARQIVALGITNQRETTILWDKKTGTPVANAIVWQSRITAPVCERLKKEALEETIRQKTGLVLDAYFSATKIAHLLDSITGLRARAERGEILFGTVDAFLMWRLSGGNLHVTDVSNASRTLLFNIHTLDWDDELLRIFNVPRAMLPEVKSCSEIYGHTTKDLLGESIPIAGCAGDQQAATFGQGCFGPGEAKNTYGTGCFMLLNTGSTPAVSKHGLLTTIGWKIGDTTTYCLEGAVFIAGAAVQWLRDGLGLIAKSPEVEQLAASVKSNDGVYFVPAFVGLGAPYWDPNARGAIVGLTRGSTKAHFARAALEAMAYQTRDVLDAMQADAGVALSSLRVDGGATANNLMMQFQSDLLDVRVLRPVVQETTALGAAYLAGLAVDYWTDFRDLTRNWVLDREFAPQMSIAERDDLYSGWKKAVKCAQHWVD
ncbi:Glycerol kinase [Caulifigura coniformis]|uniref:Glycerol kinase n=1 Tax=Caulifigura coniformis TaxID=2527983 RepID=A0A517S8V4_9PLAN|nr:glycerol kinase GlpK [Caulifigura coniformis]QDT52561.1 Glycerol kinase [Caulifigura coniformis]